MMTTREKGDWGEVQAAGFLERQGYHVLTRNYQTRFGEIDIVAINTQNVLCFIEVKLRTGAPGSAERATDVGKVRHLYQVAQAYCQQHTIDLDFQQLCFEHISVYPRKRRQSVYFQKWPLALDNSVIL